MVELRPGNGCNVLAANLAVTFAQLGERTLLIDANLRRRRNTCFSELEPQYGLVDFIRGTVKASKIAHAGARFQFSVGDLRRAPPPNPQELLGRVSIRLSDGDRARQIRRCDRRYTAVSRVPPMRTLSPRAREARFLRPSATMPGWLTYCGSRRNWNRRSVAARRSDRWVVLSLRLPLQLANVHGRHGLDGPARLRFALLATPLIGATFLSKFAFPPFGAQGIGISAISWCWRRCIVGLISGGCVRIEPRRLTLYFMLSDVWA